MCEEEYYRNLSIGLGVTLSAVILAGVAGFCVFAYKLGEALTYKG